MALVGAGAALFAVFVLLLRLALPRGDGTPTIIGSNEHVTSLYAVMLVALLIGGFAIAFLSLG
jgi:hypothetical protein